MGLLDDAIREHLELKRRHGADAAEVARQEREALGPARRSAEPLSAPPPGQASETQVAPEPALDEPATAYDEADPPAPQAAGPAPYTDPYLDDEEDWEDAPAASAPTIVPPPEYGHEDDEPAGGSAAEPGEREDDVVPRDEGVATPGSEPHVSVPFEPAPGDPAAAPPPPPEEGEDVLEETPDFLQETPEHDRLWFEQRPPRDFDFGS